MAALIIYPKNVSFSVCQAVKLCAFTIIPSLFPFAVMSGILTGSLDLSSHSILSKAASKLFCCSPVFISAFVCGICGGYPLGAAAAVDIYKNGGCTKAQAEKALSFCCNSGPSFIISAVGVGILKSVKCGAFLFGCHVLSALLTGIIMRPFFCTDREVKKLSSANAQPFSVLLTSSIRKGADSMINVCACVIFFSALTSLLHTAGINSPYLEAVIEMTHGISEMKHYSLPLLSLFLAFGGLSVHAQAAALAGGTDLSILPFFIGKCVHGMAAFLCALLLSPLMGERQVFMFENVSRHAPGIFLISFTLFLLYTLKNVWKKRGI